MPRETFYKLKDEKKQRIFYAAVQEFSKCSFSEASLNQIVKTAKIPWGSFYQYFENKEDIFSYVIETIMKKIEILEQQKFPENVEPDALTQFAYKLSSTVELNNSNPEYVRIVMMNANDSSSVVKRYFELSKEHKQAVISIFEKDKHLGLIRKDIDTASVIEMVYILSKALFSETGSDSGAYLEKMNKFLSIIRNGIKTEVLYE
ncbi:MAG: TetR/AcrR family transcriptional regulator [Clostridiales bacterium]|nr:TetR/AcrR family transcriptional regulator [Clostridiales bacterium]